MNLILLGPPNAGKGTQAKNLFRDFQIPQISTGDILRKAVKEGTEMGKIAGPLMASGAYVPDDIVIGIVEDATAPLDSIPAPPRRRNHQLPRGRSRARWECRRA